MCYLLFYISHPHIDPNEPFRVMEPLVAITYIQYILHIQHI